MSPRVDRVPEPGHDARRVLAAGRASPPLAAAEIVATALVIVQERGVEGLTMRDLADRLGVSVAAAYKHVADKESLLRLAANELFSRVEDGDRVTDDWIARLGGLMVRFYDVMSNYPGMSSYIALEPEEIPRRHMAVTMREILIDAGFSSDESWDILTMFVFYAAGALDGPMGKMDLGPAKAELLRDAYRRGLDRVLDGLVVAHDRLLDRAP